MAYHEREGEEGEGRLVACPQALAQAQGVALPMETVYHWQWVHRWGKMWGEQRSWKGEV